MSMNYQGCTTTNAAGQEQYEKFGRGLIQYDYRDFDGELFSCVRRSLTECRAERNRWLSGKNPASIPCSECGGLGASGSAEAPICMACFNKRMPEATNVG